MDAISDYDNAQNAYRAFGLANVFAASLYHDVRSNRGGRGACDLLGRSVSFVVVWLG